MMPKVARARDLVAALGKEIWVQVDGGISADTIEQCVAAGADTFVAGSAVFGDKDRKAAIGRLRDSLKRATIGA